MFGKWFDTAYTGSMAGSGADVFAVWTYAIAKSDRDGYVELNPLVVGALIGMPVANVEAAIKFLCQPDPKSRNPAHDGRRLIFQSGHLYLMVSKPIYRSKLDPDERREYLRVKQRESRGRKSLSTPVNTGQPMSTPSTHTDTDTDTDISEAKASSYPSPRKRVSDAQKKRDKKKRNSPPTKTEEAKARHTLFKAAIFNYWKSKNPEIDCPWQQAEGAQLELWLRASPTTTLPNFVKMLRHRYRSEVIHSDRPSLWIKNITSFANGPVDRYGKPLEGGNRNGKSAPKPAAREEGNRDALQQYLATVQGVDRAGTDQGRQPDAGADHGDDHRPDR